MYETLLMTTMTFVYALNYSFEVYKIKSETSKIDVRKVWQMFFFFFSIIFECLSWTCKDSVNTINEGLMFCVTSKNTSKFIFDRIVVLK